MKSKPINYKQVLKLIKGTKLTNALEILNGYDEDDLEFLYYEGEAQFAELSLEESVIVINGNLVIDETITDDEFTMLIVLGDLKCKNIVTMANIFVSGNVTIQNVFIGDSILDGVTEIGGDLIVNSIIEIEHTIKIYGELKANFIHTFGNSTDKNGEIMPNIVSGVLKDKFPELYIEGVSFSLADEISEGDYFDVNKAREFIENGGTNFHK
jgi:hypothetical protein